MVTPFEKMLIEVRPRAIAHAIRICRDRDMAQDYVQEACKKAWKARHTYKSSLFDVEEFKPWFMTIVTRVVVDDYRKTKARTAHMRVTRIADEDENTFVDNRDFVQNIVDQDCFDQKIKYISNLPKIYSDVYLCYILNGSSYEKVAKHFNMPLGTVKSRIYRAKQHLHDRREAFMAA